MRLALLALALLLVAGCARPPLNAPTSNAADAPLSAAFDRADVRNVIERTARRDTLALVMALAEGDPVVRARAAFGLGSVQAPVAVPALALALRDESAAVRREVAFALGQLGGQSDPMETVPALLLDALRAEADETVRARIVRALGFTGDRAHLAALLAENLPASLDAERALAIARMGLRGVFDDRATAWLAERVTADDPTLRHHAAFLFGRSTEERLLRDHGAALTTASETLAPDDAAQVYLAALLGRYPEPPRALLHLLESPDWRVRVSAARALGGTPREVAIHRLLVDRLDDDSEHVAITAAQALAAQPLDATALREIETWLAAPDAHPMVRAALLPALVRGDRLGPVFATLDGFSDAPFARAAAVGALAEANGSDAFARLADAASDADVRVATAALTALRARWQRTRSDAPLYYELFTQALNRADAATAYTAAPALADSAFFALGAASVLRDTYRGMDIPQDIEPMAAIVTALGATRDTTTLTFLLGVALEAPHPLLRRTATEALNNRFGEGYDFQPTGGQRATTPRFDWDALARLGTAPRFEIETEHGRIVLALAPEIAPLTVQTIARLANEGRYDGVPFHRVVPNFVIQGGDYARADGFGGPDFFLPSEFSARPYATGTLGMASAGKDTEGSQFFVMHGPFPHLEGRYTIFGQLFEGQDVVDAIQVGDTIRRARVHPGLR